MAPPEFRMKIRASKRIAQKNRTRPLASVPENNNDNQPNTSNDHPNDNDQHGANSKPLSRRQKIKQKNPARYEHIRESDKLRSRIYRLEMTDLERAESNRKAAIRQKRYRANKKAKMMEERKKAEARKVKNGSKRITRREKEKIMEKNKKDADRKRRERAAFRENSPQEYKEHLAKRREAYALKMAKKRADKAAASSDCPDTPTYETNRQTDLNSAARRKRRQRNRDSFPSDANRFVDLVEDMLDTESPSKVAELQNRGLRINRLANLKRRSLEEELTKIVEKQAKEPGKKDMGAILNSLKAKRLQRYASKILGINRKRIIKATKLKTGRKPITEDSIDTVCSFYESVSIPVPDKNLVSRKTGKPQMLLNKPVDVLYTQFKIIHPEVKIGRSQFCQLRPRHVKSISKAKYRGCLCEKCENIRLKSEVLDQRLQADGYDALRAKDIVQLTLCVKEENEEFHKPECIKRKCPNCGMKKFNEHFSSIISEHKAKNIQWRRWDNIDMGEGKKRRGLKTCEGTVDALLDELRKEVDDQALHIFRWKWQSKQYREIRKNLPTGWVLNVWDFAENYTCFIQDEAQSAYWTRNQATVHPVVNFYHCEMPDCSEIVCESVVFISSDLKHDYNAVHTYMNLVTAHLHQKRNLRINKMVRFSDGCSCQYKSFGPMADVAHSEADFNFPTCHNFYGSRHGKGASDGESAVVKSKASSAVKCGDAVITNAEQMYDYCVKALIKDNDEEKCTHFRRSFYYVEPEDIIRNRERCQVETIPGTRSLHSIHSCDADGDALQLRELACFCRACIADDYSQCLNSAYVSGWKKHVLRRKKGKDSSKSKGMSLEESNESDQEDSDDYVYVDGVESTSSSDEDNSSDDSDDESMDDDDSEGDDGSESDDDDDSDANVEDIDELPRESTLEADVSEGDNITKHSTSVAVDARAEVDPSADVPISRESTLDADGSGGDNITNRTTSVEVDVSDEVDRSADVPISRESTLDADGSGGDNITNHTASAEVDVRAEVDCSADVPISRESTLDADGSGGDNITNHTTSGEVTVRAGVDPSTDVPISRESKLDVGTYVAVLFQPFAGRRKPTGPPVVYIASILANLGGDNYQVNFMRKTNSGSYFYPEKADIHTHPKSDFIATLSDPEMAEYKRMEVYRFVAAELDKIGQRYNLK